MHGSCLAYQSRPPRQGKWCCHHWLCSLDVDTSAFFRKLLTELSATLLSRKLLFEMAHTHRVYDGSDDCTLPPLAVPDPSPFYRCRNFLPKFSHTILLTPLIRAFLFFAVRLNYASFVWNPLLKVMIKYHLCINRRCKSWHCRVKEIWSWERERWKDKEWDNGDSVMGKRNLTGINAFQTHTSSLQNLDLNFTAQKYFVLGWIAFQLRWHLKFWLFWTLKHLAGPDAFIPLRPRALGPSRIQDNNQPFQALSWPQQLGR